MSKRQAETDPGGSEPPTKKIVFEPLQLGAINNIEELDGAQYLCQVMVGINNKITKQVDLRVKTPVRLEDSSTRELTVIEGQTASLDCVASGFPAPRILWTRVDGKILFSGKHSFSGSSLE